MDREAEAGDGGAQTFYEVVVTLPSGRKAKHAGRTVRWALTARDKFRAAGFAATAFAVNRVELEDSNLERVER